MKKRSRRAFLRAGLIAGASMLAGAKVVPAATEENNRRKKKFRLLKI